MQVTCTGRKSHGGPCGFGRELPDGTATYEEELPDGSIEERVRAHCPQCSKSMPFRVDVKKTGSTKY